MNIHILNGPNLNLLGKREPHIYGSLTFEDYFQQLQQQFSGHSLHYFQSNHEGALLDKLHEWGFSTDGIIFNAGGYTHTSVALADAVSGIKAPVVEVHISRVHAREAFRHHSYLSPVCAGTITGLGLSGYALAIQYLLDYHKR
jgi:3-dehydroquinate dehydratase-2